MLRQVNIAIGNKKYKKAIIFVGDSKEGKSTTANLLIGNKLISVYQQDTGQFDVR